MPDRKAAITATLTLNQCIYRLEHLPLSTKSALRMLHFPLLPWEFMALLQVLVSRLQVQDHAFEDPPYANRKRLACKQVLMHIYCTYNSMT